MFYRNWLADMLSFIMLSNFPIDLFNKFLIDIPAWEDGNQWASQIPCLSWDPKVYCEDHCIELVLSQFNARLMHPVSLNSILYYHPFHFCINQTNLFPQCLLPKMSILLLIFATCYIVYVCMYVSIYIYVYICVCVYIYIYIYIYIGQ